MGGQVEKRRGPRHHKKTFRFLIQLSLCCERHVVLEGVENMGSTGGIRAISLAFAQNLSGPAVWRGRVLRRVRDSRLRRCALRLFVPLCSFKIFFFLSCRGCFPWRDVAKRIMGKDSIMAVGYFDSSWTSFHQNENEATLFVCSKEKV